MFFLVAYTLILRCVTTHAQAHAHAHAHIHMHTHTEAAAAAYRYLYLGRTKNRENTFFTERMVLYRENTLQI